MAYLDPQEAFQHFKDRVLEGITQQFPIKGRQQSVFLDKIEVKDTLHPDDIRSQHHAKVTGDSWSEPIYAMLSLKDNTSGKTIESRRIRVAEIPKFTRRYSFIVEGQEYQIDNQWQLKPGAYVRRNQKNEIVTKFNVTDRNSFDVKLDPQDKQFKLIYNKSKLPLYPFMKAMGVTDAELEKSWGKDILDANKSARGTSGALERFYKSNKKVVAPSKEDALAYVNETFLSSRMRPDSTRMTLGKPIENVTGEALTLATKKMIAVEGGHPEDDRDSLVFKDLRSAGDFAFDKFKAAGSDIRSKVRRQLDRGMGKVDLRDVVKFDVFNKPLLSTFYKNSAARAANQINPVEMVSSSFQTTIMGPGGIQSEKAIMDEAKLVNPSHLGFLDPLHSPEGDKTGVSLRLPLGVKKVGSEPTVSLYNLKTGERELVTPGKFLLSKVVLPDQVKWVEGKPVPLNSSVTMVGNGNDSISGKFSEADYVMRHPSQLFSMTSNLIPFLGNTSGNRASMASRHIEQAISLKDREAPLVQVSTGGSAVPTFEKLLGHQSSHVSPVDGHVVSIKPDGIQIQDKAGQKHEVQLYNNYPLNDAKSVMHSTPVVKEGDHVKSGQLVADSNFSRNGTLALGRNMRIAFIPYLGYNFEDGIVISESAAKKLSSEHLNKYDMPLTEGTVLNKKQFEMHNLGAYKRDQLNKLDDHGVVRVGQIVKPGDPLITSMKPYEVKDRTGISAFGRSLTNRHVDTSLRWDSDYEGEVVGVHRTNKGVSVHVRTTEPMQVGDKLSNRSAAKGIVSLILPDHEMPHTKDGKPIEVALNPSGIGSRMNLGQVLETAASKIALKTGKPYVVPNFQPNTDALEKVKGELKQHGLSDTEELIDPVSKQSLGKAMVGYQHMMKLVHQVDKKLSVRSGMTLPGTSGSEHYDLNLQPTSGGGTGGQSMGTLGMYALLAHGAIANLREQQTIKSEGRDPQTDPSKAWPSQHAEVWSNIQNGRPLPTPRPTFAFKKFTDMLKGAGINVEKKGNEMVLSPLTDKHIIEMVSEGEGEHRKPRILPKPAEIVSAHPGKSGELKPRPGGLFDEKLTGGHGGQKWSAIQLAEPIPNPVFEGPIRKITGLSGKDYEGLVHGELSISPSGAIAKVGSGLTGGAAIKHLLDKIDVQKELASSKKHLETVPKAKLDPLLKKVKYLQALDRLNLKPSEAYVLHYLPVVPPSIRPVTLMPDGNIRKADINSLYSEFAQVNDQLKDPTLAKNLTDAGKKDLRRDLYDGVSAIMGLDAKETDKNKGLLHQIAGNTPKQGLFQDVIINRRQDMTMRSTIVPEPSLGLDEVGLPKHAALKLFAPFVVRKLTQMGAASNPLDAQKLIGHVLDGKKNESVWRALEQVTAERPVLMKRDPALHKYNVQAFNVKTVEGTAIKIHPLVTAGYTADFDGDEQISTVVLFVSDSSMKRGMAAFGSRIWPRQSWWDARQMEGQMAARFSTLIPSLKDGSLYVCDLSNVPHLTDKVTKGHIDFHGCPEGIEAVVYDELSGVLKTAPVTGWSFHRQREIEIVTLKSGRQIITDDDERAVYGLDGELKPCRRRPKEALGMYVPTGHTLELDESLTFIKMPNDARARIRGKVVLDETSGHFLGMMAGNGWAARSGGELTGQICLAATDSGAAAALHKDLLAFYYEPPAVGVVDREGGDFGENVASRRHTFHSSVFSPLVDEWIGHGARNKHLPPFFFKTPKSFRLGLLAGFFDSDGSISVSHGKKKPQWLLNGSTTSIRLANELRLLCMSLGVGAKITSSKTPKGDLCWTINFSTVDMHKLRQLPVSHSRKTGLFAEFFGGPAPEEKNVYSRKDQIPTPPQLALKLRQRIGTGSTLAYMSLSASLKTGWMTRFSARAVLKVDPSLRNEPEFGSWIKLIDNTSVRWDQVESFERTGILEDGYDLTVPGFETFMSLDGVILSNTVSVYVPIHQDAVTEAHKMFPSNNLFSEATGQVMFQPTLESALGLYKLSLTGKETGRKFKHPGEVLEAVRQGKLHITDVVHSGDQKTTAGRILLSAALPQAMQEHILTDLDYRIDKKGLDKLLTNLAKNHKSEFGPAVNKLKDLGNDTSFGAIRVPLPSKGHPFTLETRGAVGAAVVDPEHHVFVPIGTHTLSLKDFETDKETRKQVLGEAQKKVDVIRANKRFSPHEQDRKAIEVWLQADIDMRKEHEKKLEKDPDNLFTMYKAGVKPGWDQYKQMKLAPMLFKDSSDRIIPTPITRSYSEGLDLNGYWTGMHGARRGSVMKVQEVREPGYQSKLLMNNTMHMLVSEPDCGTTHGISMHIDEPDVHDRFLAQPFTAGKLHLDAGTLLSPDIVGHIKAAKKDASVVVRSPLKCEHEKGFCQTCVGLSSNGDLHPIGTNIGVLSSHALGERSVQLTLKAFHHGGSVEQSGGKLLNSFGRFQQLTNLDKKIPNQASLAMVSGKVEKIEDDPLGTKIWIGGTEHHVGKDSSGRPLHAPLSGTHPFLPGLDTPWMPPKVGEHIDAGMMLSDPSRTYVNPHDLYKATGSIEKVQNHMANEIYSLYKDEKVKRRAIEVVVKAMSNLTQIQDPGDHPDLLRGEFRPLSVVKKINRDLIKEGKKPISHKPTLKGVDMLPLSLQEDWMAKLQHERLQGTLLDAAAVGASSNLHGNHPIPALAYGAELTAPGKSHDGSVHY